MDGDDGPGLELALEELIDRWSGEGLPDVVLAPTEREALHRRTRAGEMAEVLRRVTA